MSTAKQKKNLFIHKCDLPPVSDEILPVPPPYAPFYYRLICRLKRIFTIQKNYDSDQLFRSQAALLKEKARHVCNRKYRFVIHPLSNFARRREMFMAVCWLYSITQSSFIGSFKVKKLVTDPSVRILLLNAVVDTIMLTDILLRLITGYMIPKTREIVLEPKRIVRHYLTTYFIFDISPILSTTYLAITSSSSQHQIRMIIYQCTLMRWARLKCVGEGFRRIFRILGCAKSVVSATIIYLYCIVWLHGWTCLLKFVNALRDAYEIPYNSSWLMTLERQRNLKQLTEENDESNNSMGNEYLHYLCLVLCHFFGAGVGNYPTHDSLEMLFLSIILIFSLMVYLYSLAILLQSFGLINLSESKYEEIINQVGEFMMTKKFPSLIKKRVVQYYNYRFDKKYFSESDILNSLSDHLRMEVLFYSCRNMVDRVHLFKGLSKAAIGCMLALLKQEIFLTNDIVMRADEESGTLYFILYGTCGVQLLTGKEAMHIEDGNFFGENKNFAKHIKQDYLYMVVALESCEIYSLSKAKVQYCCTSYPEITQKIENMATAKAKHYTKVLAKAAEEEDNISASDIVADLRRGNILEQGRERIGPLNVSQEF